MALTFEEIKARFEAEQKRGIPPTAASDLPLSYEAITPEWLTAILAPDMPGAAVVSHELGPVDDGTSNRRRIAVTWNDAGRTADLPTRLFCKGSPSLETRYILGMNEGILAEVYFYQRVLPQLDISTPPCLFANADPETLNSIIVMKDMKDHYSFNQIDTELSLDNVKSQMRYLARLHAKWHGKADSEPTLSGFLNWEDFFHITADAAGFADAHARGFRMAQSVIPERLYAREGEVWPATLRCVDAHAVLPRGLIHSDVHLKNWYVLRDGNMGLNDWQCCSKGNGSRDLAYCISTAVDPEKRRAWERELVGYYIEQFEREGGPKLDFDTVWKLYRQQMFAALAWWTGTLGQPPDAPAMQPQETSIEFIRRMTVAIDDLDALDSFD